MPVQKLKEMKTSMKVQGKRLVDLNVKLAKLREKFAESREISIRNELEVEGTAVKKEVAHVEAYMVACEQAAKDWDNDKAIHDLANFKYWRSA